MIYRAVGSELENLLFLFDFGIIKKCLLNLI